MATIIVACDKNQVIGSDGSLPWDIPKDLSLFKRRTLNQCTIMGRKTYESIPERFRPLAKRKNIVLTQNPNLQIKGVTCVTSPEDAIKAARDAKRHPYVIGGEQIYKLFLDNSLVDRIIVSQIKGEYEGDVFFPQLDPVFWSEKTIARFKDFDVVDYQPIHLIRQDRDKLFERNLGLKGLVRRLRSEVKMYERHYAQTITDDYVVVEDAS